MDAETSARLFETYYMKVYSYVMTLAGDRSLSEEITQETFFKAITASHQFRGESEEFTWLCAIAKNLFCDEMRRRSRISGEISEDAEDTREGPDEKILKDEMSFRIHMALHSLDEPYREVFSMRVFGELSFAKIGTIFGKTENWARVTYHRAKMKIQERIEKNDM